MDYTHLTEEERYQIDDMRREGFNQTLIAKVLKRSKSTLSRELRRNDGDRGWRPRQAQLKATERLTARGAANVKRASIVSWAYAKKQLEQNQWSSEQIAGRLELEGLATISHETIYQRVLKDKSAGGSIYTHLRCKKKRKNVMDLPGHREVRYLIEWILISAPRLLIAVGARVAGKAILLSAHMMAAQ